MTETEPTIESVAAEIERLNAQRSTASDELAIAKATLADTDKAIIAMMKLQLKLTRAKLRGK
jgi:hypothetical protein